MGVTHRSLSVAVESSFGSLSTSTGLPDASGLSYVSLAGERHIGETRSVGEPGRGGERAERVFNGDAERAMSHAHDQASK